MSEWVQTLSTLLWAALAREPTWMAGCHWTRGICRHCGGADPGVWLVVKIEPDGITDVRLAFADREVDKIVEQWHAAYALRRAS